MLPSLLTQTWLYKPHEQGSDGFQMLRVQALRKRVHIGIHQWFPTKLNKIEELTKLINHKETGKTAVVITMGWP